jgi:stearoyl-CoA desaturase (delta-9 desaturase)
VNDTTIRRTNERAGFWTKLRCWLDSGADQDLEAARRDHRVDWLRIVPFLGIHAACVAVIWVGSSPIAVAVAIGLYLVRAFFVTAFYHRYFSHRTFRTSRAAQFVFGVLGSTAVQRGPLWWAAHHRNHHGRSDREGDPHSPHVHGVWWSHMGWITSRANFPTDLGRVKDLARFRELRWLDRYDIVVPAAFAALLLLTGWLLGRFAPSLGTNAPQMLVWGFFVSTVILFHVTCLVNSAAHLFGRRRFATRDQSRNSLIVALLTLGEGWHNNHHHYPAATRQGFYWWEIDITYWVLKLMARIGLIWDLTPVPARVLADGRRSVPRGATAGQA